MKIMKKISAVLLSLCLVIPCFTMVVSAADGRISFTDPNTSVGEYVEVKCVLRSTSGDMGTAEVGLTYDEEYLKFESGDGIEANGSGTLSCVSEGGTSEITFLAKFQALQEGTTKVEIASASITDMNSLALTLDQGNSTITIAEGDSSLIEETTSNEAASSSDVQADINGVTYTLENDFADADIPNGYSRTTRTIDGAERQMVENESGAVCLAYMTDAEGKGDFFLYNEEDATFSLYAEINISDTTSIIMLDKTEQVSLSSIYAEATLTLDDKEFTVWQDTEQEDIYVFYVMNNSGEKCFYQYDSAEGTYQKFEPEMVQESAEGTQESTIIGKVQSFVEANLTLVIIAVFVAGILGLLIIIVLAVKLHNRNAELDELYDEYGIDLKEDEVEEKQDTVQKKKEKKSVLKRNKKEDFEEDDFEETDFEEEDFEEADFEEEDFEEADFEEADFEEVNFEEDFEEDFTETNVEELNDVRQSLAMFDQQEEEFAGYTERMDFTIDDLDELLGEKTEKKQGHIEADDTFKIDFIDLD